MSVGGLVPRVARPSLATMSSFRTDFDCISHPGVTKCKYIVTFSWNELGMNFSLKSVLTPLFADRVVYFTTLTDFFSFHGEEHPFKLNSRMPGNIGLGLPQTIKDCRWIICATETHNFTLIDDYVYRRAPSVDWLGFALFLVTCLQYTPRNMHTVLLCFTLLWLCNRS